MKLKTLGGLGLENSSFRRPKPLLLLCYLALEGPKERRFLAELFWPSTADSLNSLSKALSRLREGAAGVIKSDDLRAWVEIETDAEKVLSALESGEIERGVSLYSGAFLDGFYLPGWSSELEEWIYTTREFLAGRVQEALLHLGEREARGGKFREAAKYGEAAYKLPGSFGLEPANLERLYSLLLAGDSPCKESVQKEAEDFNITLTLSKGEAQERLMAVQTTGVAFRHSLPDRLTSFVGRSYELDKINQLLSEEACRLLTLTGAGGSGKTRLALEVAHSFQGSDEFKNGVYFIPLESLTSAGTIATGIVSALDLRLQEMVEPLVQVRRYLQTKHMLLILDNFEHLLEETPLVSDLLAASPNLKVLATSRERLNLAEEWVLPVDGLPLPPDNVQDPQEVLEAEAIQLFVQRAKQADVNFTLTAENLWDVNTICQLVDGSPLGIELAAVWTKMIPCADIATEIEKNLDFLQTTTRNVSDRHRSIRATFEHSWKLLAPQEQEVLSKLSVFRGGFSREAAQEVAEASIFLLVSLVDKSLLRIMPSGRYDWHPLLHDYVQEKLTPEETSIVRQRHTDHFLKLVERGDRDLVGPGQPIWLNYFETEYENIRTALEWTFATGTSQTGPRLVAALGEFWRIRGYRDEAKRWLKRALSYSAGPNIKARLLMHLGIALIGFGEITQGETFLEQAMRTAQENENPHLEVDILQASAMAFRERSAYDLARERYQEALAVGQNLGDKYRIMKALCGMANIANHEEDNESAWSLYEQSLALARELEDPQYISAVLEGWSVVALKLARLDEAQKMAEEGFSWASQVKDVLHVAFHKANLGLISRARGNSSEAKRLLQESLVEIWDYGERIWIPPWFDELAAIAWDQHDFTRAARLFGAAKGLHEALGAGTNWIWQYQQELDALPTQLGAQAFLKYWNEGRIMSFEEAYAYALEKESAKMGGATEFESV